MKIKSNMKTVKLLMVIGVLSVALLAFTKVEQDKWVVPAKYENMKNPTNPKEDLSIGKSLYDKHCKSCHGKEGYGDGTKADGLKGDLGDGPIAFKTEDGASEEDINVDGEDNVDVDVDDTTDVEV